MTGPDYRPIVVDGDGHPVARERLAERVYIAAGGDDAALLALALRADLEELKTAMRAVKDARADAERIAGESPREWAKAAAESVLA